MSHAPQTNVTTPPGADPLAGLHKMSTTAGVTNLDYVAVNQTAIAAVLLGLLSAVSFFGHLLLVIPIVGIVFAVVALRQISNSNGTQTGRGLALLALLLCLGLGGTAIGMEAFSAMRVRGDENAIASTLSKAGGFLKEHKYKEAYDLFDPEFRKRVSQDEFSSRWQGIQGGTLGALEAFEWNGVTPIFENSNGRRNAGTKVRVKFNKGFDDRFDVVLREEDAGWQIFRFESFFPSAPPPGQGGPGNQKSNDVFNF